MKIADLDLPPQAKKLILKRGIDSLFPPQAEAIRRGLLDGESLVLAVPTASGKTLIAELAMLQGILSRGGKAIYMVPLKALASEKFTDFAEFEELGIKVIQSTGDFDSEDFKLANYDLIICTNEKIDSLLRHDTKWVKDVEIIISDEVHLIDDANRGPTLEVVLARLKKTLPNTQILALSATISNADEIADWLDAKLVQSDWRPVKLSEGVYWKGVVEFSTGSQIRIPIVSTKHPEINIAYDTIKNKGQILVFANTRASSQATSERIGQEISRLLTGQEKDQLVLIAEELLSSGGKTKLTERLAKVIQKGCAFHHAGLKPAERKIVENNFRMNLIKCVCATPTLAAGVNLPARRVVIMSLSRYQAGMGNQPIKVLEYKQQAGRAGRPKYDTEGESIIIAKKAYDLNRFMQQYCLGETEMIWSKLASESALRSHMLAEISIGYVSNLKELTQFIKETFYGYQNDISTTEFQVKKVLRFLKEEGMIENEGVNLWATKFGHRVSQLYIDPLSAVIIRNGLKIGNELLEPPTEISFFQLIATTPDLRNLYLRQKDQTELQRFLLDYTNEFLTEVPEEWEPDFEYFLMGLKTAILLSDWIEEKPEEAITTRFNVGSGDILYLTDNAKWLLYSAIEIGKLFHFENVQKQIREIHLRISHGIRKELVPLVKLRGIGRVRARLLFNNGFKTIASLRKAEPRELAKVPAIGPEIVRSIKEQVGNPMSDQELQLD